MRKCIEIHALLNEDFSENTRILVSVDNIIAVTDENEGDCGCSVTFHYSDEGENASFMAMESYEMVKAMLMEGGIHLHADGTLEVEVPSGKHVNRVFVCGDDHWGGLYYPDEE